MKYRTGDRIMSKRIARCEKRIVQDIARPKKRQFHIGKLWVYYDASRPEPVIIEGMYHPKYECMVIPAQIRFVYWGNSIAIFPWFQKFRFFPKRRTPGVIVKVIRLKGKNPQN